MIEKIRVSCNDGESSRDGILEDIRKVGGVESAKRKRAKAGNS